MDDGYKQDEIINQTIARGWKGFFAVKKQSKFEAKYEDAGQTPAITYQTPLRK